VNEITAIILAGGKGTRLRSVVADRPKPLALVAGRPFIEYLFNQLGNAGINQAIISTGYLGDQIYHQFGAMYGTLSLHYSQELHPLGTAGALRHALPLVASQTVLVLNGDSYCDVDVMKLLEDHKERKALITMTTTTVSDVSRYGTVRMTSEGLITDFIEKGDQAGGGVINAGIYVLSTAILANIAPNMACSLEKDILPGYCGQAMYAHVATGIFIDIGIPEDYQRAQQLFDRKMSARR
jgi:NDP-sugar pyrophosphorylase family protein